MGYCLVEFNGIPGSGKSTLAKLVEQELKNKSFNVITETDIFLNKKRFEKALNLVKVLLSLKLYKFNMALLKSSIRIFLKNKNGSVLSKAFKIMLYNGNILTKIEKNTCDFIILSEGCIQFISHMIDYTHLKDYSKLSRIVSEYVKLYDNIFIINCTISIEESIKRIEERISNPNSINLLKNEELKSFIRQRDYHLKNLRNSINYDKNKIAIDMHKDLCENKNILLKRIIA